MHAAVEPGQRRIGVQKLVDGPAGHRRFQLRRRQAAAGASASASGRRQCRQLLQARHERRQLVERLLDRFDLSRSCDEGEVLRVFKEAAYFLDQLGDARLESGEVAAQPRCRAPTPARADGTLAGKPAAARRLRCCALTLVREFGERTFEAEVRHGPRLQLGQCRGELCVRSAACRGLATRPAGLRGRRNRSCAA